MMILSKPAAEVIRRSHFVCVSDLGINVPNEVQVEASVQREIEAYLQAMRIPVHEAATAALAAMIESEGLQSPGAVSVLN
jgi:hypothetical protein